MTESMKFLRNITFVGVTSKDIVKFENKELRVTLVNILEPIVKLENCKWLSEDCFECRANVVDTERVR